MVAMAEHPRLMQLDSSKLEGEQCEIRMEK